jgi:hypothetical protein
MGTGYPSSAWRSAMESSLKTVMALTKGAHPGQIREHNNRRYLVTPNTVLPASRNVRSVLPKHKCHVGGLQVCFKQDLQLKESLFLGRWICAIVTWRIGAGMPTSKNLGFKRNETFRITIRSASYSRFDFVLNDCARTFCNCQVALPRHSFLVTRFSSLVTSSLIVCHLYSRCISLIISSLPSRFWFHLQQPRLLLLLHLPDKMLVTEL